MATGDWAPDTKIEPTLVNVTFNADGAINHIGIGYRVILPSGDVVAERGYTWHSPDGDYAHAPAEHVESVSAAMRALLDAAAAAEGVDGVSFRSARSGLS